MWLFEQDCTKKNADLSFSSYLFFFFSVLNKTFFRLIYTGYNKNSLAGASRLVNPMVMWFTHELKYSIGPTFIFYVNNSINIEKISKLR